MSPIWTQTLSRFIPFIFIWERLLIESVHNARFRSELVLQRRTYVPEFAFSFLQSALYTILFEEGKASAPAYATRAVDWAFAIFWYAELVKTLRFENQTVECKT